MEIDLNADLGEGAGTDAELMPFITSANVCCGVHAGNDETILATLKLCKAHRVRVGAHPGYADRANFGRVPLAEPTPTLLDELKTQLTSFMAWASDCDVRATYLKPHGALYNQAVTDERFANIVLDLAVAFSLPVVGLPDSELESACLLAGHPFVSEGFADRRYNLDGTLVPRAEPNAVLHDVSEVVEQVRWLSESQRVRTICVHGDTPDAVAFTAAVRDELLKRGFTLKAFA